MSDIAAIGLSIAMVVMPCVGYVDQVRVLSLFVYYQFPHPPFSYSTFLSNVNNQVQVLIQ
jgi:hypothetical protein